MGYFSTLQNETARLLLLSTAQILCISCLVHAEVAAESNPKAIAPPWELYDTDKDDYISAEEAAAQGMAIETFKTLDIDRDGSLNKEEFSKAPPIQSN